MNFANPDMVGHTGDEPATIIANQTVDKAMGMIVDATLAMGGVCLVTADHGNAEEVKNLMTGDMDKEHSTNPVPLLIIGKQFEGMTRADRRRDRRRPFDDDAGRHAGRRGADDPEANGSWSTSRDDRPPINLNRRPERSPTKPKDLLPGWYGCEKGPSAAASDAFAQDDERSRYA